MSNEVKPTQSFENKKSSIEYMPYNEVEAKVSKEKSKLEATRDNIYKSITKNETIIKGGGNLNALTRIIKEDKGYKLITLRVGTKPIHKMVVDVRHKDLDILSDLKSKTKSGEFDAMIRDYFSKPSKRKVKSSSVEKSLPPELSMNYNSYEETSKSKFKK